jgi:hypothetical protein
MHDDDGTSHDLENEIGDEHDYNVVLVDSRVLFADVREDGSYNLVGGLCINDGFRSSLACVQDAFPTNIDMTPSEISILYAGNWSGYSFKGVFRIDRITGRASKEEYMDMKGAKTDVLFVGDCSLADEPKRVRPKF